MPLKGILNRQILMVITSMLLAIMVVVWWYTKPDSRVAKAAEQVIEIADAVHKNYIGKPSYWKLNNQTTIDNKILTNRFYKRGELVNALGKPILIGSGINGDPVMPGERSFDIVYTGLSQHECVALATHGYEQSKTLGLLQITINNGEESQSFGWGEEDYELPVSRLAAKKFCQKNSSVIWTME